MFDSLFDTTPKDKFEDIIFNANRNIVSKKLDLLIEEKAIIELLLEEKIVDDLDKLINQYKFNNLDKVEARMNDLYIETTANILTECE